MSETSMTQEHSLDSVEPAVEAESADVSSLLFPVSGHNALARVRWRTSDLIAGLLFLAVWRGLVLLLQQFQDALPAAALVLIGAVVPILVVGLLPIWAYRRGRGGWPVQWPSPSRWLLEIALAIPVMFVLFVALAVLSTVWPHPAGDAPRMDPRMQEIAFSGNPWLLVVMALGACLWAPVAEELFFRGFLQNSLGQRIPTAGAAILQTVIFALVHPYQGLHLVAIGLIGGGLTLHYLWRKTLIATMLLHALFNGFMLLLLGGMMLVASQSGVLGVRLDPASDSCRVAGVYEGSGADTAGLQGGDVITAFDNQPVVNTQALQLLMLGKEADSTVRLTILRDGHEQDISLQLSPRKEFTTVIRETSDAAR